MPVCGFQSHLLLGTSVWNPAIRVLQPLSQILSARIATGLLQVLGIPAFWSSTKVVLSNVTLEVMRECSGVNQVLAIVALALPSSYVLLRGFPRRFALVGLSVMVAYLSNGVRIALVGLLAYRGLGNLGDFLQGMHVFEGVVVSAFGYLVIFACIPVLSRIGRRRDPDGRVPSEPAPASSLAPSIGRAVGLEFLTLVVMLLIPGSLPCIQAGGDSSHGRSQHIPKPSW